MDKAPDAYRTISEVAEDLDLPQHVLRFWETRFTQIKPLKRGGGRRYYRPDDVELLKGIRHLLYKEGYTIKGVQRILKEQGARAVQSVARPPEPDDWQIPEAPEPVPVRPPVESPLAPEPQASVLSNPAPLAPPVTPPQPATMPGWTPLPVSAAVPEETETPAPAAAVEIVHPAPAEIPVPPPAARPQVSMFRGGLMRGEASTSEADADFAAELREKLERERMAPHALPPAPPVFQPLPMPDQNQRALLGTALEELLACKGMVEQLLRKRAATA